MDKVKKTRKRIRMAPEVRRLHILEAALVEFSAHGVEGTRVELIARRAGLSKAGIYTHFSSKDAIFEATLAHVLQPWMDYPPWQPGEYASLEEAVDAFLQQLYSLLDDPRCIAVLRMLIGSRSLPDGVIQWREQVLRDYIDRQQLFIDNCVAEGLIRHSALTEHFLLACAPAVLSMFSSLLWKDRPSGDSEAAAIRLSHRRCLLEWLAPGASH